MEIKVTRRWQGKNSTLSSVTVDGNASHFILEDKDRGLTSDMPLGEILEIKVKKETAIPTGRYQIIIDYSPAFKKHLPRLLKVPGFAGILIHLGNWIKNTDGCLLPGKSKWMEDGEYVVGSSRTASEDLQIKITNALKRGEEVWITIERDYKNENQ